MLNFLCCNAWGKNEQPVVDMKLEERFDSW